MNKLPKNKISNNFGIRHLEHNFESMVVYVFIFIEGSKDVECVAEANLPWNSYIASEDWKKMSGTDYGINMHNRHDSIFVAVEIRLDNPHAVVRVGIIERFVKFVEKCA